MYFKIIKTGLSPDENSYLLEVKNKNAVNEPEVKHRYFLEMSSFQ